MFTGIVQALGILLVSSETDAGKRLTVSLAELNDAKIEPGDSVCVSGVCLTVVKRANGSVHFDVISETLRRSTLGSKKVQDRVNIELSLQPNSFVGGHFVQGHVDAVAKVVEVKKDPKDWRITFEVPQDVSAYLVPKGSVAVDGVSMTIAEVKSGGSGRNNRFTLAVIPTTLERTTLSSLEVGDAVNVETDILARTVVNYLQNIRGEANHTNAAAPSTLTVAKLKDLGMA